MQQAILGGQGFRFKKERQICRTRRGLELIERSAKLRNVLKPNCVKHIDITRLTLLASTAQPKHSTNVKIVPKPECVQKITNLVDENSNLKHSGNY